MKPLPGSNREFSLTNAVFIKACELAEVEPTQRQASRWRNGKGTAIRFKQTAIRELAADHTVSELQGE
jgi:hypothetical protein